MGMTDLEALLRPISEESRCGPDLDAAGDPAYVELGVAAEWKEAKYVGDQEVSPAVAPDWQQVKETGGTLLAISKDLRIAKHYVAALAHTEGLSGFAAGVRLLHDLLERYWEGLHPALEGAEDDWRKNLVMELNAERGALGGLRAAPIAESRRAGRYTVSHIEVLDGAMPAAEGASAPTAELLREAVRDSDPAAASARLESCRQALADLKAIQAVFRRHQPSVSPDFPLLEKLLRRAAELLGEALGAGSAAAASGRRPATHRRRPARRGRCAPAPTRGACSSRSATSSSAPSPATRRRCSYAGPRGFWISTSSTSSGTLPRRLPARSNTSAGYDANEAHVERRAFFQQGGDSGHHQFAEVHRAQPGAAGSDRVRRRALRRAEEDPAALRDGRDGRPVRQAGRAAAAVADRKFLEIDVDNFDERLKAMKPRVAFQVPNTLTGEGNISVDITFESMDDFSPAAIARKVEALNKLLEARTQLSNLLTYMDGKTGAEDLIAKC